MRVITIFKKIANFDTNNSLIALTYIESFEYL